MSDNEKTNNDLRQNLEVINYYNAVQERYNKFWMNLDNLAIHYGYYDEGVNSHENSLIRMNQFLANKAKIKKTDLILDAGCGVGGSSIWLARNIGSKTIGITLVEKQLDLAKKFAKEKGVEDLVQFKIKDFTNTGFEDEIFDVVWAVESVCHTIDKKKFIDESYRILKKDGGRLIVSDYFMTKDILTATDAKDMEWISGWALPNLCPVNYFNKYIHDIGFKKMAYEDATNYVLPSSKRMHDRGVMAYEEAAQHNLDTSEHRITLDHIKALIEQYGTLTRGLWSYGIFFAEK
jgi:tocopherol O-methyltransferase